MSADHYQAHATVPIPERHPAGRSCGTVVATLAVLTTLTAALVRRKT